MAIDNLSPQLYNEAFGSAIATPVSFTINVPSGTAAGHLLILSGACRNSNDFNVTNATFTTLNQNSVGGTFFSYRVCDGTEPFVLNVSLVLTGATSYSYYCSVSTFTGVDGTTPIDATGVANTTNPSNSLTTTKDGAAVFGGANALVNAGNQYAWPSPFVEITDGGNGGASNRGVNASTAWYIKATAGATGTITMPANGNYLFALRPAAGAKIALHSHSLATFV